ncbi:MAG: hypothetical protein IKW16_03905 [Clostridia bacterium]|nr:hypothetical protein [Clostridia bacterium]
MAAGTCLGTHPNIPKLHEISLPKIGQKTLETLVGEIFAKANKKNQSKRKIALRFG